MQPASRAGNDPDTFRYYSDRIAVDSATSVLSIVAWLVLVLGTGGVIFVAAKMTAEDTDAVAIVAYVVPMALLLALTWGVLYGLAGVIRGTRLGIAAPLIRGDEDDVPG